MAMMVNNCNLARNNANIGNRYQPKRKDGSRKEDRFCDNCKINRHTRETCFKITGYLDWFKQKRNGRQKFANLSQMTEREIDNTLTGDLNAADAQSGQLSSITQQEITRTVKGKMPGEVNCVEYAGFAGVSINSKFNSYITDSDWILDSGATTHRCFDKKSFITLIKFTPPNPLLLLNMILHIYSIHGTIKLYENFLRICCTYLPLDIIYYQSVHLPSWQAFQSSLLLTIVFYRTYELKHIVVVGKIDKGLYKINSSPFLVTFAYKFTVNSVMSECTEALNAKLNKNGSLLWHSRFGHASY